MTDPLLSEADVTERLQGSTWSLDATAGGDGQITREVEYADFTAALAALNRVAAIAEAENHHPDLLLYSWNRLRVSLTNHAAGGLTAKDFDVAARFDAVL
jgi:4a-hydroxytetrahydrobiopterin dehydratase